MFPGRFIDFSDWNFRSPFKEFDRMRQEMNRIAEAYKTREPFLTTAGVFPLVNLSEDTDNYYVRAELPGMDSENIEISATENSISIAGERIIPEEKDNVRYHRRERESGNFSRMISLPGAIDADKVEAKFSEGILSIKLPKSESMKPKQIVVK